MVLPFANRPRSASTARWSTARLSPWLRHQLGEWRLTAAHASGNLAQLLERTFAIDRAFAVGEEGLPRHPLRIGDPLLVGFGVAAGCCLRLDNRALGAGAAVINFCELLLVLRFACDIRYPS